MYFPKSQITPNLYTNGGEFVLEINNLPYIGYYFETSNGKFYTGKNPSDKPNEELVFLKPKTENYPNNPNLAMVIIDPLYNNITNSDSVSLSPIVYIPYYSPVIPTQQDYQIKEFRRYFCKKTNELIYIEINQQQCKQLVSKDPQILWQLYEPFFIDWQISGDKQQVIKTNRNSVDLLVLRQKFIGLNEYIKKDYSKYYQ